MSSKINWTNKLRDRGFVDQWGFMVFAVIGFGGIVSAKWFDVATPWVAAGAILAMLSYALLIGRAGTGSLRADQAGANCYYLGLIYTLASLSYAIAIFDPNDTASTIVRGFGIALATTIFGLILRVFFNQGRPDLENVESGVRLELTNAAGQLKGELSTVVVAMNDFARIFQQSMEEMHKSSTSSIEQFSRTSVEGMRFVVEEASQAIRAEANDFAARSKKYTTTFDKLLSKLDQHCASLDEVTQAQEAIGSAACAAKDAAEAAKQSTVAALKSSEALENCVSVARESLASMSGVTDKLDLAVRELHAGVISVRDESERRINEIAQAPSQAVSKIADELSRAAAGLSSHLLEIEKMQKNILHSLAEQSEAALSMTKRNNSQLESELDQSRGLVRLVHSSLVDMTGRLADKLEDPGR